MSDATSAALQLEIDTGSANETLDALELKLGALGDNIGDAGAKRLAVLTESLQALKVQAEGAALAFKESQAAMNSAGGGSSTAEFAKMREQVQALQTQLIASSIETQKLKESFGVAGEAGTKMGESMRGMAIRVSSSIGDASTSIKGLVTPLDDTNVGLTKLQTKLQETTAAFAKGIDPGALAKDVDTQIALASSNLQKLERVVANVRKAAAFTEVGTETAISKYGKEIVGLVPHLQELDAALAKDKAALALSEETAAKAAASRKALTATLREGAAAAREDAQALAAYRTAEASKTRTVSSVGSAEEKEKLRQIEAAWNYRNKLEEQHTAYVAAQAKARSAIEAKAAAEIMAHEATLDAAAERSAIKRTTLAQKAAAESVKATRLLDNILFRRQAYGGLTAGSGAEKLAANLEQSLNATGAAKSVEALNAAYVKLRASVAAAAEAEAYLRKVQVNSAGATTRVAEAALEQQEKARIALARSNNKLIETEEKSHLDTIARMRAESSRLLAQQSRTQAQAALKQLAFESPNLNGLKLLESQIVKVREASRLLEGGNLDLAIAKYGQAAVDAVPKLAQMERVEEILQQRVARTKLANEDAVRSIKERAAALNSLNAIELATIRREEQLAVAYAKRSEASKIKNVIEARRVIDEGLDPSKSFSAQSIAAAKAATSIEELRLSLERVQQEERDAARSVDTYTTSISRAIALEKAWILSSEKLRVAQAIDAKKLLTSGWKGDIGSSFAPQTIALAQSTSLSALEKQYNVLSSATGKATTVTKRWSDAAWEAHSAARGLAGSLGGLWATYGSLVPLVAGAAIGASAKAVFDIGKDLQYQLKFVSELSDGATVSLESFAASASGALQTPIEAAEGMRALAQAGLDVETSFAALPSVLNLATVGELGVGAAALSATGAIHAFGLSMAEIGRVGDVFAKAAAISNTSVQGMTEAMKQASTVADFYGVSLEDTSATLALLAQRNIEGSAAGTAFRNMMSNLTSPTQEAKRAMKELNLSLYDSQGNLKGYREVLEQLSGAFANLDQKSRLEGLAAIFTERGLKAANTVLTDYSKLNILFGQMEDSAGFVNTAIAGLKDTIDGDLKRAIAGMQITFATVFNENEVAIHNLTTAMAEFASSEGFKEFLDTVVKGFITLGKAIRDNIDLFTEAGKVWLAAAATMKLIVPGILAVGVGLGTVTSAAVKASVAFRALNAATGWIGLLGTLAATFLLLGKNTDEATEAQTRFQNRSNLLIDELDRQNEALQGQIKLLDLRKAALLSGDDASEGRNVQRLELQRLGDEIEVQAAAAEAARAKLNKALSAPQENSSVLGVSTNQTQINRARAELRDALQAKDKATQDYLSVYQKSTAAISASALVKTEAEAVRNLEAAGELNARIKIAAEKGKNIKPIDIQLFDKLNLNEQKALLEEYKSLVGYEHKSFSSDKGAEKAGRDARKAALTELKSDLSSFEGEYRASVERSKGLADEMKISTEEMFDLQQQALVGAWAAANEKLAEMRSLAQGDPKELANVEKTRQKLADDYVVNTEKLNNARLKANRDYYDKVEELELASGRKTLTNTETFSREWYAKYGEVLEQALLRTKSSSAGIAEAAVQEVAAILGAFDLASYVNDITTDLKRLSSEAEVFKNGLTTLVNKDTDGGLVGALLGSARDIENWKAAYIPALQEQLRSIDEQIANYDGDAKGLSGLVADASKIRKEIEEGLRTSSPSVKKFSDDLGNLIAEGLVYGFKEGESPMKSFSKMMKAELVKAISGALSQQYNMIINTLLTGGGSSGSSSVGGLAGNVAGSSAFTNALSALGTAGTALGALTTGFGAAGASVAAVGLGGTLSAAGSLIGAGLTAATFEAGAAGVAAGVGLGAAALAPYLSVAALILDATGVFKGATPHRGGAYVASTDGTGFKATNANTPDFGLSWGAYTSDRNAGVDTAVRVMADGMAASLAESMAAFDVDNAFSVAVKFASDNDDWSQGAFKVFDEAGAEIVDFSKKYTKNAAKALDEFGVDTQRAVVAALATIDLGGPVNAIFDSVDPIKSSIEEITAALEKAQAWVTQGKEIEAAISQAFDSPAERLSAAFEAMSTAIPDTADAYEALVRAQDLNTTAGRELATVLVAAKPLWDEVQQAAIDAADEAKSAWQDLLDSLTEFRDSVTTGDLAGLSPEAAYQAASVKFTETDQLARLGNQEALGSLADVSRALLEASKAYYASGEAYFVDKQKVLNSVDSGIALADRKIGAFANGGVASGWSLLGEEGPELVNFTRPGRVYTASQTREVFGVDKSSNSRDEEIIVELKAIVGTLVNGIGSMDARLANLEKSSSEQAREARMANDRRRA